jgi:IS4 transposase
MLEASKKNRIEFRYVLNDVWYASALNMRYVKEKLQKEFIMPLKANRKVALSLEDKKRGAYEQVASVELEPGTVREVYLEQVEFPLLLVKQVFKNEDASEGVLYLVSSDVTLDHERLTTIYQRRWKVEEYHKSLKVNASLAKSPTKTIKDPKQPLLRSDLRVRKARADEASHEDEPLCYAFSDVSQSPSSGFQGVAELTADQC